MMPLVGRRWAFAARGVSVQWFRRLWQILVANPPTVARAVLPLCVLSVVLYTRNPLSTNFIFDEQEALLANPYVRSVADAHTSIYWSDAFRRDFWGLLPDRSIGSYRPIPDLFWRFLWMLGAREKSPFVPHFANVLFHGINGALLAALLFRLTKRAAVGWVTGVCFVTTAVLTEAVSGVVGIADVLAAQGILLVLWSLSLTSIAMVPSMFVFALYALLCKESALAVVFLAPYAALAWTRLLHPSDAKPLVRATAAWVACTSAFTFYVTARKVMFPVEAAASIASTGFAPDGLPGRVMARFLAWYAQPALPHDPLNNPLVSASTPLRVAGAMRVYARGLVQILFPCSLSGDYSAPQEPVPPHFFSLESVLGGVLMVVPLIGSMWLLVQSLRRSNPSMPETRFGKSEPTRRWASLPGCREACCVALFWIVVSYFPVSNIPILLPTVRAERFWYFPALGTSVVLSFCFVASISCRVRWLAVVACCGLGLFVATQSFAARRHANDYKDDLTFWDATRHAVPRSAKAHLNYSVMKGARGDLAQRLVSNRVALDLAPDWPMANIYYADTLCRLHRLGEAWPYYTKGFDLAPNDMNLISLALQCVWEEHYVPPSSQARADLETLADNHPGSWLAYLTRDTLDHGDAQNGVDPKYRPRAYNEGPKHE